MFNAISTNLPQDLATSSNPWAYLVGILIIGIAVVARIVWGDMKKREKQMMELDAEHRKESKERQAELAIQLNKSIEANMALSQTQQEMVSALNGVSHAVTDLQYVVKDVKADVKYLKGQIEKRKDVVQ